MTNIRKKIKDETTELDSASEKTFTAYRVIKSVRAIDEG